MTSTTKARGTLAALSDDLAFAVERAGRAVVAIRARPRIPASGVLWRSDVAVATDHTIRRDEEITVMLPDGRTVSATLAGRDPSTDLAVLRLGTDAAGTPAELGEDDAPKVGRIVLALGRPGTDVTASLGLVSVSAGEWRTWRGGKIDRFIRLDITIHDGFSGGPLIDAGGSVVGINTSGLARGQPITIPNVTVRRVVEQLLTKGRVARGYLGLAMHPVRLPQELVAALGLTGRAGLMLVSVESGSPGAAAGLVLGDIIVEFDGHAVRDPVDLLAALGPESVGHTVRARVIRAGAVRDLEITVGERGGR
jgi:S1-C subfamily serine protease